MGRGVEGKKPSGKGTESDFDLHEALGGKRVTRLDFASYPFPKMLETIHVFPSTAKYSSWNAHNNYP